MNNRFGLKTNIRDDQERRRIMTFPHPKFLIFGQREQVRRESDLQGKYYTDHRRPGLSVLIIFIVVMCILDWGLTLINLDRGAVEMNPFMAMSIEVSEMYFFFIKYTITSFGLFILYLYKDFFPTHKVVFSIFIFYFSLTMYHIVGYHCISS